MSGFSAEERAALLEPLNGLEVDPTKEEISMTPVSPGAAGTGGVKPDLKAYYDEFGQKAVDRAYARGWRPKEEHKGNPENWIDPIDFFDRYAETSDKRAEKEAAKRLSAVEKTVEKRMQELAKRVDRIDETDRQATEQYYAEMIASAQPKDIPKLLKDRDKALADIDAGRAAPAAVKGEKGDLAPETEEFFERHPYLIMPGNADDAAMRTWAMARAAELEAKYPSATLKQVYNQLTAEIDAKRNPAVPSGNGKGGRDLSDAGGGGPVVKQTGKFTPADLSGEEKAAFASLVSLGAYKDDQIQKYCDDLAKTKAEEAMSNVR